MHLIIYTSECTLADSEVDPEVNEIFATAKRRNSALGVTGVLFYENRHFLQVLEGDERVLRGTFARIMKDPRHRNVRMLVDEPIESRSFPDWAMGTFFVESPELVDSETLKLLHRVYEHHYEMNAREFIEFLKKMIDELDTFGILRAVG